MRISDWSSDVCSSDRGHGLGLVVGVRRQRVDRLGDAVGLVHVGHLAHVPAHVAVHVGRGLLEVLVVKEQHLVVPAVLLALGVVQHADRSEEHTSELKSLMRNSYAVFCLKNKYKPK